MSSPGVDVPCGERADTIAEARWPGKRGKRLGAELVRARHWAGHAVNVQLTHEHVFVVQSQSHL